VPVCATGSASVSPLWPSVSPLWLYRPDVIVLRNSGTGIASGTLRYQCHPAEKAKGLSANIVVRLKEQWTPLFLFIPA
jgi:hypothetical protein